MNSLECPVCHEEFLVDDYDSGECPKCHKAYFYWDDGWDYELEETGIEGFIWEII
jgi:hypothetical protein